MHTPNALPSFGIGLFVFITLTLAGCGGGGEGAPQTAYNPLWVSIDTQCLNTIVATSQVELQGSAYCDNCPNTTPNCSPNWVDYFWKNSAIDVSWTNLLTGKENPAYHGIYAICSTIWIPYYSHRWLASVPLGVGDNNIEVRASDIVGNSAVKILNIKRLPVTGLNDPTGIAVDTLNNEIFVSSTLNSAILVYGRTDNGNVTPQRIITGSSTGLDNPRGIAMDFGNNRLYTLNSSSITSYFAQTASGDVTPIGTITGASTGLVIPQGMAVDNYNQEIFVTNSSSISVFPMMANGDVAPIRTIVGASTGLSSPGAMAVDTVNNEIFVTNIQNTANGLVSIISVYARTANGDIMPVRTISGSSTGLSYPYGIALDTVNNELFVVNVDATNILSINATLAVFGRTASGNVSPLRTISVPTGSVLTVQNSPSGIAVDTVNNEIFLTYGSSSILVYQRTASGNAIPIRTITNPTSGI